MLFLVPRGDVYDGVAGWGVCSRCWRWLWRLLCSFDAICLVGPGLRVALAGGAAVALVLLQLMGAGVSARFDLEGLADEGRLETYKSTLRMIDDHPWLGTGQGTFAYAFPAYRSPNVSLWGVWDLAHNTLLEIAADMGVPLAALVVAAWLAVFVVLVRGAFVRRGGLAVPVAGLAVAILAVLHSLIDFSLQIPGFAIVALCLVGAGLAQSFPRRAVELGPPISAQGVPFHPDPRSKREAMESVTGTSARLAG